MGDNDKWQLLSRIGPTSVLPVLSGELIHERPGGGGAVPSASTDTPGVVPQPPAGDLEAGQASEPPSSASAMTAASASVDRSKLAVLKLPMSRQVMESWVNRCNWDPQTLALLPLVDRLSSSSTGVLSSSAKYMHTVHRVSPCPESTLFLTQTKSMAKRDETKLRHQGKKETFADIPITIGAMKNLIQKMLMYIPNRGGVRGAKTHCTMAAFFATQWHRAHRVESVGTLHISELIQEPLTDYVKVGFFNFLC